MKKQIANVVTGCRILCGAGLLLCPVFSGCFYALYLLGGLTDMEDGTIARKMKSISGFGAKLDTAADFVFMAAACIKWLPHMEIPAWLWVWAGGIVCIKFANMVQGITDRTKGIFPHTAANKIAGLLLFLLPLTLPFVDLRFSAPVVCAVTTFSAIQERYYIEAE